MFLLILGASCSSLWGQATIGTLYLDEDTVDKDSYTLIYPNGQTQVYLIDNCGGVVHSWQLPENSFPGSKAILDSLGNLYVAMSNPDFVTTPTFGAGGAGGILEKYDWDGSLQWRHILVDSLQRQHHDFEVMPNGNILALVWQRHSLEEIVEMGFDTLSNSQRSLWSDSLVELDSDNGEVVWQWNAWDHLVQDYDSTKLNFNRVSEHLGRIDVNYTDYTFDRSDWLHANSVAYDQERDQIVISIRNFHELWVIDHSTTTEEAASSSGGNSSKGGDLLYRWGNPDAYQDTISPKILNYQHDASWYFNPNIGTTQLLVYNNWYDTNTSLCHLITPIFDENTQTYQTSPNANGYLPESYSQSFTHPDTIKGFSTAGSSVQILDNSNVLMCAARQGRVFEVTQNGELAWEYLIPFRNGFPMPQGSELQASDNFNFEARKYPKSYIPLNANIPEILSTIEFGEDLSFCETSTSISKTTSKVEFNIMQNPVVDRVLHIKSSRAVEFQNYHILDANGHQLLSGQITSNGSIALGSLLPGFYIIHLENVGVKKFILL